MKKKRLLMTSFWRLILLLFLAGCLNEDDEPATAVPDIIVGVETAVPTATQDQPVSQPTEQPVVVQPTPILIEEPDIITAVPLMTQLPTPTIINPPAGIVSALAAPGTTVRHTVNDGEWMLQIARCYGTTYTDVRYANWHIWNPDYLIPVRDVLTIPNVGSIGPVIGVPCVQRYTVQANDTWETLAVTYQTSAAILQRANPGPLTAGRVIIVPTITPGSVVMPGLNRDLLFNYDGNLAVWRSSNGRVDLYTDDTVSILDLTTNDTGDFALVKQTRDGDQTREFALINRMTGAITLVESGLPASQMSAGKPFLETMLISPDGQWGAYLTGQAPTFQVTAFPTSSPGAKKSILLNHGSDELPPRLFAGVNNDYFMVMDNSGIYEYDYALITGENTLHAIDPTDFSNPLLFEGVSWSPSGRYLLMQGYYIEGGAYFILDRDTGQIIGLPNSNSYVNVAAAAWLLNGTAVVLSPPIDTSTAAPLFAIYQPQTVNGSLQLISVIPPTTVTLPGGQNTGTGYIIASPPVQTALDRYVMVIRAGQSGLWALPFGGVYAFTYLNQMPASFWQLKWLPDSSGLLVEVPSQSNIAGDVVFVSANGGQPFSLVNWLGLQISDFYWVQPAGS